MRDEIIALVLLFVLVVGSMVWYLWFAITMPWATLLGSLALLVVWAALVVGGRNG